MKIDFVKNMPISVKLKLTFGLLLVLATINATLGVSNILLVNNDYTYVIEYPNRRYYILYSTRQHATNLQRIVTAVALHTGEHDEEAVFALLRGQLDYVTRSIRAGIEIYKDSIYADQRLTDFERALSMANMLAVERVIETHLEEVTALIFHVAETYGRAEATDIVRAGAALYDQIYSHLSVIYSVYSERMYAVAEYLHRAADIATMTLVVIAFICILIGIAASVIISKAITVPIKEVVVALDNVSAGNLNVSLNSERADETGQLISSAQTMVKTLQGLTGDLEHMSSDHDKGEIDTYVEAGKYTGVYKDVVEKVNYMVNQHLVTQSNVVKVFTEIAYGNFDAKLEPLPGKKALLNDAVDTTITSRQAADKAKMLAEEANKSKSNFLAMMSHEIRTPLNGIIGIAQIQLQKEGLQDEYSAAFNRIYSSGDNLLRIINDILDMSKIEVGKFELVPVEYYLASLVNDVVQLNMVRIGEKAIKFSLNVQEDLPAKLFGDDLRIKQVLNNLISNAIKYTERGYVKLSVSHFKEGGIVKLRFTVSDTGQGMRGEDIEKLFLAYSRFNAEANRATEGAGLGMNITQRLVEMMGGTIEVESEYGKGSTFVVTIEQKPLAPYTAIGAVLAKKLCDFTFSDDRKMSKMQVQPMPYGKVLVVDDTETNLYVAQGLLAPYKLEVETADSGYAALEKVRHGNIYDIVFMDHMMPHMDGIETTQRLRSLGYQGAIVALTANALAGNDEMFRQNGFDGFIPKPIDIKILDSALNKFIRDRRPEKQMPEADAFVPQAVFEGQAASLKNDPKMLEIFRKDAEKAIVTLRETLAAGDLKLFTTTAHAMRSALHNVGKSDSAAQALEEAGRNADTGYINANTEAFIETLKAIVSDMFKNDSGAAASQESPGDAGYLAERLSLIQTACENYDDEAAFSALAALKERPWKKETADALENIHDVLFLHSDFDKAGKLAKALGEAH
ncbi:MAG: ATP-binding protein [Spirochaetes bacterium]|nr:ATP-binding protein [Spirochaetota bacterium]